VAAARPAKTAGGGGTSRRQHAGAVLRLRVARGSPWEVDSGGARSAALMAVVAVRTVAMAKSRKRKKKGSSMLQPGD
jgi:hypothetical protein